MSIITPAAPQKPEVPEAPDYSPSLKQAARALWGDDFWGAHAPRPDARAPTPQPASR